MTRNQTKDEVGLNRFALRGLQDTGDGCDEPRDTTQLYIEMGPDSAFAQLLFRDDDDNGALDVQCAWLLLVPGVPFWLLVEPGSPAGTF